MDVKEFFNEVFQESKPKEVMDILNSWVGWSEAKFQSHWSEKSKNLFAQAMTIGYRLAKNDLETKTKGIEPDLVIIDEPIKEIPKEVMEKPIKPSKGKVNIVSTPTKKRRRRRRSNGQ